jgi:hypothetical protein
MKRNAKGFVLLLITVLCSIGLSAQNLVVTLKNSATESFPVSGIRSIKFGAETMVLNQLDGTVTIWNIEDIDKYAFDEDIGASDPLQADNSDVIVFPNPAANLVNIQFTSGQNTSLTIDIIDSNGKHIQQVYMGDHQGTHAYQWNSSVPKGVYYCRIATDSKVITKPIIIQ